MSELARLGERLQQRRADQRRALERLRASADSRVDGTSASADAGPRVVDLVTGQEGTIVGYARENIILPFTRRADG